MIYNKGFGRKKHEFSIKCIIKQYNQLTIKIRPIQQDLLSSIEYFWSKYC